MLKLLKYELRKTLMAKLILLGLTGVLEIYFLYGIFTKNIDSSSLAAILLTILAMVGVLFIGIQSIVTLHRDMNTKQSHMLFMTPHSNYAILGAKALEFTISVALALLFFFGLGVLDVHILFSKFGNIQNLLDFFTQMVRTTGLNLAMDPLTIFSFVFLVSVNWIETVMTAFLADVIACSLLRGKRFGGLLTFLLFIVLTTVSNRIVGLIPAVGTGFTPSLVRSLVLLGLAGAEYAATATIMEKKLSV